MPDIFDNIRDQESEILRRKETEISSLNREIDVANKVSLLKSSPGFHDYQLCIQDLLQRATNRLVDMDESTDLLRQQQGRVQALRDILTIFARGENLVAQLAQRREALQAELNDLRRRMPRQATP